MNIKENLDKITEKVLISGGSRPSRQEVDGPSGAAIIVAPTVAHQIQKNLEFVGNQINITHTSLLKAGCQETPSQIANYEDALAAHSTRPLIDLMSDELQINKLNQFALSCIGQDQETVARKFQLILTADLLNTNKSKGLFKTLNIKPFANFTKKRALKELGLDESLLEIPQIQAGLGLAIYYMEAGTIFAEIERRADEGLDNLDKQNLNNVNTVENSSKEEKADIIIRDKSSPVLQQAVSDSESGRNDLLSKDPLQITSTDIDASVDIVRRHQKASEESTSAIRGIIKNSFKIDTIVGGIGTREDIRQALIVKKVFAARALAKTVTCVEAALNAIRLPIILGQTAIMSAATNEFKQNIKSLRQQNQEFINEAIKSFQQTDESYDNKNQLTDSRTIDSSSK